jgi:hypothetical protein
MFNWSVRSNNRDQLEITKMYKVYMKDKIKQTYKVQSPSFINKNHLDKCLIFKNIKFRLYFLKKIANIAQRIKKEKN